MPDNVSKSTFEALQVPGGIGRPRPGGDYDLLLDGMSRNSEVIAEFLAGLAYIRDPYKTPYLSDLERDYGIAPSDTQTDAERRETLAALIFETIGTGSPDNLQNALDLAGYSVFVETNDPAVDPESPTRDTFRMAAGDFNAFAGRADAFAGVDFGPTLDVLVNGDIFKTVIFWETVAGGDTAFAGNSQAVAGGIVGSEERKITYPISSDPDSWPFFFWVGGEAIRDGNGRITKIESVLVPADRQNDFRRLILRIKPMHSWAILVVEYV